MDFSSATAWRQVVLHFELGVFLMFVLLLGLLVVVCLLPEDAPPHPEVIFLAFSIGPVLALPSFAWWLFLRVSELTIGPDSKDPT